MIDPADVQRALAPTRDDLQRAAAVLHEVFRIPRFADDRYLDWFYRKNPVGQAIEVTVAEGDKTLGHLAGIPQVYARRGESMPFVFPLNIAVSRAARGRGLMTTMSLTCFEATRARYEHGGLVGMPNAASTPGYTGKLGFRLVRPLPVLVCPPFFPALSATSQPVDSSYLQSAAFEAWVDGLDLQPGSEWGQAWSPELLKWRLSAPGARYTIHTGPEAAVVTTAVRHLGIPVTVVLKTFARRGAARPALANAAITAACLHHRSPVAVYAGFSSATRVLGLPLPDQLKPAPLNLIVRSLCPGDFDQQAFEFGTMEFFDFDAY